MNGTITILHRNLGRLRLLLLPLLLIILPLFFPIPVFSQNQNQNQNQALSRDQILDGLTQRYSQLDSLTADYRRVAVTPSTEQIFRTTSSQEATGLLSWSKPSKLRLGQKTPLPELMVTDGTTVWWHIPAEKLAYRYRNINVAGQLKPLLSFFGGLDSLKADYEVSPAPADPDRPGQYGLILLPREGGEEGFDRLSVWCDRQFTLTGFKMTAITGETTDFHLTQLKENSKPDPEAFTFEVPPGTEIIEE